MKVYSQQAIKKYRKKIPNGKMPGDRTFVILKNVILPCHKMRIDFLKVFTWNFVAIAAYNIVES